MYKDFELYTTTYEEDRLRYFREQLKHQERRLEYAIKHLSTWDCADRGAEVSFYQDVVNWLEGNV